MQKGIVPTPSAAREKSLPFDLEDLPPSVTKRRRKAPMQRSQTLPANLGTVLERPKTPPLLDTVETLDLLSSPVVPSPSQLPAKKAKTRTKTTQDARLLREVSVASSPGKTRQTTLDTWRASATPTKLRGFDPAIKATSIPAPLELHPCNHKIDELDLTLSSPTRPERPKSPSAVPTNPRRIKATSTSRPPLISISSNTSLPSVSTSTASARSKSSKNTVTALRDRRTSPRLQRTSSVSPEVDTLDLTSSQPDVIRTATPDVDTLDLSCLSSPVPPTNNIRTQPQAVPEFPASPPPTRTLTLPATLRRSPHNHTSSPEPPSGTSPPAAWKARKQRKREIILRKSVAGAWDFVDIDTPQKVSDNAEEAAMKGKHRKKWRESEVDFLDLT